MPPDPAHRPPHRRPVTALLAVALLAVLPATGCAAPPERRVAIPVAPPTPAVTVPPTTAPTLPPTDTHAAGDPDAADPHRRRGRHGLRRPALRQWR